LDKKLIGEMSIENSDTSEKMNSENQEEKINSENQNQENEKSIREKAKAKAKLKQQLISEQKINYSLKEGQKRYELKKWNSVGLWQWGK
jgi:hypothetical protein